MELETLNCNNCGAPLQVPESANFVTCNHCHTRLAIRRTESTTFTEKLEAIGAKQEQLLEKITRLERQNEVAFIDRQWEREKQRYMITDEHGRQHLPSEMGAVLTGVAMLVFGVVWLVGTAASGGGPMVVVGLLVVLIGLAAAMYQYHTAKDYRTAARRYRQRRKQVYRNDATTPESHLAQLQHIPTPREYLEQLEEDPPAAD